MNKSQYIFLTTFMGLFVASFNVHAQFSLDVESGVAFPAYNEIQVPGTDGTRFDLNEELEINNRIFYRIRLSYLVNPEEV